MKYHYLQTVIPIISIFVNLSTQIIGFRCIARLGLLKSEYLGFAVGLISLCVFEYYSLFLSFISAKNFAGYCIANLIIYASLGYCYFHFINLGETARRIRIIREIYDSKEGLTMAGITLRYSAREIFEKRIKRLIDHGQIVFKGGRYYIGSPVMLLMAKIIRLMKILLFGKESEFYKT